MSDFAGFISKALKESFPSIKHGKCFYHLKANIKKRYPKKYPKIEPYLEDLGNCLAIFQLDTLWKLIKEDIKENEDLEDIASEFVDYFENFYMKAEEKGFFIGFLPPGFGNTNNMLEGHRRFLKGQIFEYRIRDMGKLVLIKILKFKNIILKSFAKHH